MSFLYNNRLLSNSECKSTRLYSKVLGNNIELLCFDEFFVSDIGDAMLLSGLCRELFSLGITLVFTSNCKPEELYRNGLQRERFLPTIDLINQYCQILSVNGDTDHRLTRCSRGRL